MKYTEQEISLTDADREKAKSRKEILIISTTSGIFLLIAAYFFLGSKFWFVVVTIPVVVILAIIAFANRDFILDMTSDTQLRIWGRITNKYNKKYLYSNKIKNIYYYLAIGSREFSVSRDIYNQFKVGEPIVLDVTYYSKRVLRVVSLYAPNERLATVQEIPITDADREKIKKELASKIFAISVLSIVFLLIMVGVFSILKLWFVFILPAAFLLGKSGYMFYNYSGDLERGTKLRVSGAITYKRQQTTGYKKGKKTYYYITIDKREIMVPRDTYLQFKAGEEVAFDFTYRSKMILNTFSLSEPKKEK